MRPLLLAVLLAVGACTGPQSGPQEIIDRAIERYGGDRFDNVHITFEFRGTPFEVTRQDGRFRYQRIVTDGTGEAVVEVMDNEGSWAESGGSRVSLSTEEIYDLETAVNSLIYFGFLPFRLDDEAVILTDLGTATIDGESYDKVEVTFEREGGGVDWDARFVHWIHQDDSTLDYLAYAYSRDGGGTRFRRAVNRRERGGIVIQDYENYAGDPATSDIALYDRSYEDGALELLSMVELEGVEVGTSP